MFFFTPLQGLFSSPGRYWNLTNSISPILRTSSPGPQHQDTPSESSRARRGQPSSRLDITSSSRHLSAIASLSPLSDVSTLSSESASLPETTPSAPSSSAASQAARNPSPPVVTADDWEIPTRRYSTRTRAKTSTLAPAASVASTSQHDDTPLSSVSPESSTRKRVKRPRVGTPKSTRPVKKARQSKETEEGGPDAAEPVVYPRRTFPTHVPMEEQFALMYRQFPVCSYTRHGKRGCVIGFTYFCGSNALTVTYMM